MSRSAVALLRMAWMELCCATILSCAACAPPRTRPSQCSDPRPCGLRRRCGPGFSSPAQAGSGGFWSR
eukprot:3064378-Rhodomonas_salina.2